MLFKRYFFGLFFLMISNAAISSDYKNTIGLDLGLGIVSTDINNNTPTDAMAADIYYRRMFNPFIGIEVGAMGTYNSYSTMMEYIFTGEAETVGFYAARVSAYITYPIGSSFHVFSKLGVGYMTSYVSNKTSTKKGDSEVGGMVSGGVGWHHKRFGLQLGVHYTKSDTIQTDGVIYMLGSSISF